MKVRVKQEMMNDDMRTKSTLVEMHELDFVKESAEMYQALLKYTAVK